MKLRRRADRRALGRLALPLVLASLALGCASGGGLFQAPRPSSAEPWELPEESYPTQRLYRIKYRGPEGDLGFKLTLYLESDARYRMLASDFGRKLWSLSLDGEGGALWLDYKRDEYCRSDAADTLRFVPLADMPLAALPKLLLGRLPAPPVANLARDETAVTYLDASGHTWNGRLAGGAVEWWSLLEDGEPVVWWRREDGGGVFSDRERRQEVRWKEIVSEALDGPLAALEIPADYRPGECLDGGS